MFAFQRLYRGYGLLLRGMGLISALSTFVMMALVVANIFGRYLLNKPVTGTLEFTESLLVLIIFLSVALTQYDGGHIRVTLLTRRLPKAWAQALNVFCMLAGAAFFAWCAYAAWRFAAAVLFVQRTGMGHGGVPALAGEIRRVRRHLDARHPVPARRHRRNHHADQGRRRERDGAGSDGLARNRPCRRRRAVRRDPARRQRDGGARRGRRARPDRGGRLFRRHLDALDRVLRDHALVSFQRHPAVPADGLFRHARGARRGPVRSQQQMVRRPARRPRDLHHAGRGRLRRGVRLLDRHRHRVHQAVAAA